jgi:enamine deaminase RidA (YjgF/YER057c/UK114 family)
MMAATAAAMGGGMMFGAMPMLGQQEALHTIPDGGPPYLPIGGVQVGPDGENGNPPPGPIGAGSPAGAPGGARRGGGGGRAPRAQRPRPGGIVWISGTGIERQPAGVPWDMKEHTRLSMENVKRGIERMGGTMDSFLYMQVFFCLHLDDGEPMPTGSKAFAAYQKGYEDINSVYGTYWQGTEHGAPPRSCFALSWIPGNSLFECVGAAYIPPTNG